MEERRLSTEAIAEVWRYVEELANEEMPTVEFDGGGVFPALAVYEFLLGEPADELPEEHRQLREDLELDVMPRLAARGLRFPGVKDGEVYFIPVAALEASYPENHEAFEAYVEWHRYMYRRSLGKYEQASFAVDVLEDLKRLEPGPEGER